MGRVVSYLTSFVFCMFLVSCAQEDPAKPEQVNTLDQDRIASPTINEQANQLFDDIFEEQVARSPESLTYLGRSERKGEWDDISEAAAEQEYQLNRAHLKRLMGIDAEQLNDATKLNWQLLKQSLEESIEHYRWRYHDYPANQMFGVHSGIPSLLISAHGISTRDDAVAYIERIKRASTKIDQLIEGLKIRKAKGVVAPAFVFPMVIDDSKNIITGIPFDNSELDSPLWADFKRKVEGLENTESLLEDAKKALTEHLRPGYLRLITYVEELQAETATSQGVWSLPDGDTYYAAQLKRMTTTDLGATAIHAMGVQGVEKIHAEIKQIMKTVEFEGSMQEFFNFMRIDPQFYYPSTEEGKTQYLAKTLDLIDAMEAKLPELFITLPKAELEVKAVEPFREKSAGKAFYRGPAPDGSRPGMYYVNLYEMADMPNYQMEALAYHEALPGHHMQISINQEIEGAPKFRRFGYSYTAYIEGWGLYSEKIPKEMGFYSDPYSDFGRLAMELWRAARLVVDTGLHSKKWTREQAIDYLVENTPNTRRDCQRAIERYMVMPGQATAYYVGMNHILKLRAQAKEALGDTFDIREFHDLILANGSLPLNTLGEQVSSWLESK